MSRAQGSAVEARQEFDQGGVETTLDAPITTVEWTGAPPGTTIRAGFALR